MARVSKKTNYEDALTMTGKAAIRTAIYARLSCEDNLSGSASIEHQVAMIREYAEGKPEFEVVATYVDNGFTGTNYNRPDWCRLMEDVKAGKIDCIIVKDLSRLGRNYIETGSFIEKICPFFGLRLIAINDRFDTESSDGGQFLSASLSNIVNDCYAKDISRKVSTALRIKMEQGEYIGSWAKYGYFKSPKNKNLLLVDPETAPVVQLIYQLRAQGVSYMGINRKLNDMGIPSPSQRKADHGIVTNNNQKSRTILWNKHMINIILNDVTYLGHLAQRKNVQCLYKGLPPSKAKKEDWIVVKNTHEAIIDQELFDAVQEINRRTVECSKSHVGKYDYLPKAVNLYGGKFTCADCGSVMKLQRSFSRKGDKVYFTFKCPVHEEHGDRGCFKKRITLSGLDQAVLSAIQSQFDLFLEQRGLMDRLYKKMSSSGRAVEKADRIKKVRNKIAQKKELFSGLYQDMKEGLLSEDEYSQTREVIMREISRLERELDEAETEQICPPEVEKAVEKWSTLVKKYYPAKKITEPLVESMIDSIQLHRDNSLTIRFRHKDCFDKIMGQVEQLREEII